MNGRYPQLTEEQARRILSQCIYDPVDFPLAIEKLNQEIAAVLGESQAASDRTSAPEKGSATLNAPKWATDWATPRIGEKEFIAPQRAPALPAEVEQAMASLGRDVEWFSKFSKEDMLLSMQEWDVSSFRKMARDIETLLVYVRSQPPSPAPTLTGYELAGIADKAKVIVYQENSDLMMAADWERFASALNTALRAAGERKGGG